MGLFFGTGGSERLNMVGVEGQFAIGGVGEAAALLKQLGFIGGSGTQITYPGPGVINTAGVTQLQP